MLFHLDVKLAAMKEDQKKMQMTTFAPSSADPHVAAAFRALKARDELSVRSLVHTDKSLLTAVDAVTSSTDRTDAPSLGVQAATGGPRSVPH